MIAEPALNGDIVRCVFTLGLLVFRVMLTPLPAPNGTLEHIWRNDTMKFGLSLHRLMWSRYNDKLSTC